MRQSELIDGHLEPLTIRETEVLTLMAQGMPSRQIGLSLGISYATVRSHIRSVGGKLGAHSKDEAIVKARQLALIT
jgi:LuxR family maltose regulon positive regulatory protein